MCSINDKKCGCKGIRTCLLCETLRENFCTSRNKVKVQCIYKFCPHCKLCWPEDEGRELPLYLGKLTLILDFLSEEEEAAAIAAIDGIQWMPSQSGRRKQDFGPKVNFKKKKVKVGTFKGFPKFTENILQRFKNVPELSNFQAVELCHLEYSPERGSSIDPHVDDSWLWGERLVTVNLGSSTVLTLVPFTDNACECSEQSQRCFSEFSNSSGKIKRCCNHFQKFPSSEDFLNAKFVSSHSALKNKNAVANDIADVKLSGDILNPEPFTVCGESEVFTNLSTHVVNHSGDNLLQSLTEENQPKLGSCYMASRFQSEMDSSSEMFELTLNEDGNKIENHRHTNTNSIGQHLDSTTFANGTKCDVDAGKSTNVCSVFRTGHSRPEAAVRIVLPPRSLLILAGCARYNWYHEIKRQDVVARRLAMTFRELTPQFLEGGEEGDFGKELLSIASNICGF